MSIWINSGFSVSWDFIYLLENMLNSYNIILRKEIVIYVF